MIKAILFDLDATLLGNDVYGTFLPGYYKMIAKYMAPYVEPDSFLDALNYCVEKIVASTDTNISNHDLFWTHFEERTGLDPAELKPPLEIFYREQFPNLAPLTRRLSHTGDVVSACFDLNLQVVIATNPLFPLSAIEQRLAWAGVPVSEFNYDLVTSYENMHSAKPNPSYYTEILAKIHCEPGAALMVGDSWENDIVPAAAVGLYTYWINQDESNRPPAASLINGWGSLEKLNELIAAGWLETLPG